MTMLRMLSRVMSCLCKSLNAPWCCGPFTSLTPCSCSATYWLLPLPSANPARRAMNNLALLGAAWRCLALLGARLIRPRPTQQICKATRQKVKASNIIKQSKLPVMFLTDSNVSNSFEAMATFSWPHCARKSVRLRRGYSLN